PWRGVRTAMVCEARGVRSVARRAAASGARHAVRRGVIVPQTAMVASGSGGCELRFEGVGGPGAAGFPTDRPDRRRCGTFHRTPSGTDVGDRSVALPLEPVDVPRRDGLPPLRRPRAILLEPIRHDDLPPFRAELDRAEARDVRLRGLADDRVAVPPGT